MSETVVTALAQRVESELNVQVSVRGEGSAWVFDIVGECFEGLSRLQRQKLVNPILAPALAANEIHAVILNTRTPDEAESAA